MKVGYVRVSTKEQNTVRQDKLMGELEVEKVYTDRMSGKKRKTRTAQDDGFCQRR